MNKGIWKDKEELQEYLNKLSTIVWKKSLKRYKEKFWEIDMRKWASVTQYYKIVFSSKFITIEEYLNNKKEKKSIKSKKKQARKKNKQDSIEFYRKYIKSEKWQYKRVEYFIKYKFRCQCCKKDFIDSFLCLHHHTYDRVWKEKPSDLVVVCKTCHHNIHFKNWKKVRLQEKLLRERFAELKVY